MGHGDEIVLAELIIERCGIGHEPILLRGVSPECALEIVRHINGKRAPLESVSLDQNYYYQGGRNAFWVGFRLQEPLAA